MKKIKLLVAGALLASCLSVTGAAFAKEKEGGREDYVGKNGFTMQETLPTQTVNAENKSEVSKQEEAKTEESKTDANKAEANSAIVTGTIIQNNYFGKGTTNKN